MRPHSIFSSLVSGVLLTLCSSTSAAQIERRTPVVDLTSINAPTSGDVICGGCDFDFNYGITNWFCHPGYTPFDVYLLQEKPTDSSLNATGGFDEYLYFLGPFLVSNFPGSTSPFYLNQ